MGMKFHNYYRKKNALENPLLRFEDGDNVLLDEEVDSPFLGDIPPGKTIQATDNNLFRAPVFKQVVPETDFLLVRSGELFIRCFEIFTLFSLVFIKSRKVVPQF